MTKPIDRAEMKAQTRKLLQTAQVSPKGMTALYCACLFLLSLLEALIPGIACVVAAYIIHYGIYLQDEVDHTL